jgi:hypothetical protein
MSVVWWLNPSDENGNDEYSHPNGVCDGKTHGTQQNGTGFRISGFKLTSNQISRKPARAKPGDSTQV